MSEQIRKLFDDIAPRYDLINSLMSLKTDAKWRREAVKKLSETRFRKVLDLCAGTLALTGALLQSNPSCVVRAVDFSQPMLKKGWEMLPKDHRGRVEIAVADAMKMRIPSQSYDGAMCAYGMRNIDDNALVLRKIRDLLKPGGRLVVLEFFKPEGVFGRLFHFSYAQIVIPTLGRLVSGNPMAYRHLRDSVRGYYTAAAFRELLKETGFERIEVKALTGGICHLVTAEAPLQAFR